MTNTVAHYPTPPRRHHIIPMEKKRDGNLGIEVFQSPPGFVPITQFQSWRVVININEAPMPLEIGDVTGSRFGFNLGHSQVAIMAPNVESSWRWTGLASAIVLDIPDGVVQRIAQAVLGRSLQADNSIVLASEPWVRETVEQIDQCLSRQRRGGTQVAQSLADVAIIRAFRARADAVQNKWVLPVTTSDTQPSTDPIDALLTKFRLTPDRRFNIAQMCEITGLTKSTLLRRFKAQCGETPMRYLTELRASRACTLISEGQFSMSEISEICGFADQAHMSRTVKAKTGLSPKFFL